MTRVLTYTSPSRGHLFPVVPIMQELARRGHDVSVRTMARHVDELVALGLDGAPLAAEIEAIPLDDWQATTPQEAQVLAFEAFGRRAPHEVADLRSAIGDEQPDVLLVDIMSVGGIAMAEASGLPWASWLPYPAWLRGDGIPPYGPGLPPLAGPEGIERDAAVAEIVAGPAAAVTAGFNEGRAAAGLEPLSEPDDILLQPPALLYLTAEPFEYHRSAWPASFHLIGPCSWEPSTPSVAWLDDGDDRAVVLVSTSTDLQDDGRLVSVAFEALEDRNDLLVVATVPAGDPASYTVPRNGRVESFVSHAAVLARAVAVICHGGMGITPKALAAGVPVCAVPFGRDQPEVASRVEVSGAGVSLPPTDLDPQRLRAAVETTNQRRDGARRVAEAFAAAGGAIAAADAIESLSPLLPRRSPN